MPRRPSNGTHTLKAFACRTKFAITRALRPIPTGERLATFNLGISANSIFPSSQSSRIEDYLGCSSGIDPSFGSFSLSPNPLLSGRRALVTGGAIGIGRGIAFELAREGVEVGIHYYNEEGLAGSTKAIIEQGNGKAQLFQTDLDVESGVTKLVEAATRSCECDCARMVFCGKSSSFIG